MTTRPAFAIAIVAGLALAGVIACALTRAPIPGVLEWAATGSLGGLLGISLPASPSAKD